MSVKDHDCAPEIDEASWIYLSSAPVGDQADQALLAELVEACAKSGWKTVSHPSPAQMGGAVDPGRFFSSVSHAVEHADVVVAVIGSSNEMTEAELTLAYSHGRPVVGVQIGEAPPESQAEMLLHEYGRARIVSCEAPEECALSLQETLSDPVFVEAIRQT
ncbi:MAG TPA: hypothetical protein VF009_09000 [Solirubrobacterales bacterium]